MLNVAFVIYREWGLQIFLNILSYQKDRSDFTLKVLVLPKDSDIIIPKWVEKKVTIYYVNPEDTYTIDKILLFHIIDIVCFYSWSWIVRKPILDNYICLCLHPSPLPKYRGGTPIQHQILNGETDSAVTIFKMSDGIDNGDIYMQTYISFLGTVNDIFIRMVDVGSIMTKQLIEDAVNNKLTFYPQKHFDKFPPLKRRIPSESEIAFHSLTHTNYIKIYNLVRSLLDPYPNAFIVIGNKKVLLQSIAYYSKLPKNGIFLTENTILTPNKKNLFLTLKDGYAKLVRYIIKE